MCPGYQPVLLCCLAKALSVPSSVYPPSLTTARIRGLKIMETLHIYSWRKMGKLCLKEMQTCCCNNTFKLQILFKKNKKTKPCILNPHVHLCFLQERLRTHDSHENMLWVSYVNVQSPILQCIARLITLFSPQSSPADAAPHGSHWVTCLMSFWL